MSREIEFRGLRVDGKGWVYGNLVKSEESVYIVYDATVDDYRYGFDNIFIPVFPESVGQYTGESTKSGTKIFDGDKLSKVKDSYWEVKWDTTRNGWNCWKYDYTENEEGERNWQKSKYYPLGHSLSGLLTYANEVIGNIHEPEKINK